MFPVDLLGSLNWRHVDCEGNGGRGDIQADCREFSPMQYERLAPLLDPLSSPPKNNIYQQRRSNK